MTTSRVSIKDVAKAAGVSLSAVSRALNSSGYISDDKRDKVNRAIAQLGYRPNTLARSLVSSKSRTIGLCLPYLNMPFIASLMEGVESEAEKHGYDVFMCHTKENPEVEKTAIERMLGRQVDGLVVVPVLGEKHYLKEFAGAVPTMYLLRRPRGIGQNLILATDSLAARRSFALLLKKGHRRIGVILGPNGVSTTRARWKGIAAALDEYGVGLADELIERAPFNYQKSYEAAKRLLSLPDRPTAIYAMHYWASTALMRLANELRLSLPRDLSLSSYESFEDWSAMFPLPIATNIFPAGRMGSAAVSTLHELIVGGKLYMPHNIEIEPSFFPHDSVKDISRKK